MCHVQRSNSHKTHVVYNDRSYVKAFYTPTRWITALKFYYWIPYLVFYNKKVNTLYYQNMKRLDKNIFGVENIACNKLQHSRWRIYLEIFPFKNRKTPKSFRTFITIAFSKNHISFLRAQQSLSFFIISLQKDKLVIVIPFIQKWFCMDLTSSKI